MKSSDVIEMLYTSRWTDFVLFFKQCTKLRQKVYGDNHPLVQQSLDFFATVYAEVGKVQYTGMILKRNSIVYSVQCFIYICDH